MKSKGIIIVLACLAILGTAQAQESKKQKFEFGVETGMTTYTNYSAVSVMQDAAARYTGFGYGVHFGWLLGRNMVGIDLSNNYFNTSAVAVNENMLQWSLAAGYRYYMPIGSRFEAFIGAKLGARYMLNTFDYAANHYSTGRWSGFCNAELGVNCKLTEKSHIGITWTLDAGSCLNSVAVPTGLTPNERNALFGQGLKIHYGLRF